MPSRQDQLHSYQFMVSRVVAALVMRETDPAQSPFRRVAGATFAGLLLSALALGGVAAYGLIVPGGSGKWQQDNVVIEEKGTGAKYLYRAGVLHPVANYTSALLVVGAGAKTVTVAHDSLDGAPRGVTLGIPDAPDSLPPAKRLNRDPWVVCSRPGATQSESVLFAGGRGISGGDEVGDADPDPDHMNGKALLVSTPDGAQYLLWGGYRHLVHDPDRVTAALLWGKRRFPVATALINALPAGQDVRVPDFNGDRGRAVTQPVGGKIGQVYRFARTGSAQVEYFVPVNGGVASLTPLEASLILNDPQTGAGGRTTATDLKREEFAALVNRATPLAPRQVAGALPNDPPELVEQAPTSVCVGAAGAGGKVAPVRYNLALPTAVGTPTTGASATGTVLADRVVVAPGSGVLVESVSSASAPSGQVSIVTDLGIQYAVPSSDAQARLGYTGIKPVQMPVELVALLPRGPSLDPIAAAAPVAR